MDEPVLYSIDMAAMKLGIGRSKVYELVNRGKLLTVHIGRRRLVRSESLQAIASGGAA